MSDLCDEEHPLFSSDPSGDSPLRCGLLTGHDGGHVDARECIDGERAYVCPRCERKRPWSDGAADDTPALCDDCAAVVAGACRVVNVRLMVPQAPTSTEPSGNGYGSSSPGNDAAKP